MASRSPCFARSTSARTSSVSDGKLGRGAEADLRLARAALDVDDLSERDQEVALDCVELEDRPVAGHGLLERLRDGGAHRAPDDLTAFEGDLEPNLVLSHQSPPRALHARNPDGRTRHRGRRARFEAPDRSRRLDRK